jgi:hypothetical protein
LRRELNSKGFEGVVTEEVIRDGKKAEEILKQIDEDEDVSVLVLGASSEAGGPGPLVAAFTGGPIPNPHHHRPGRLGDRGHKGAGVIARAARVGRTLTP